MAALPLAVMIALAHSCAPSVAPETLLSVSYAESAFDPFKIGVNTTPHRALSFRSAPEAQAAAETLLRQGVDFDIGVAQLNLRTLHRLGLTLREALDPCRNLAASASLLTDRYLASRRADAPVAEALQAALSAYNTGDPSRGVRNGYVARVRGAAEHVVPALRSAAGASASVADPNEPLSAAVAPAPEGPRSVAGAVNLDVFAGPPSTSLVWRRSDEPRAPSLLITQAGDP